MTVPRGLTAANIATNGHPYGDDHGQRYGRSTQRWGRPTVELHGGPAIIWRRHADGATDDGGNTGSDPGLTGTATSEADSTVAIEVSAPVTTGLTGQLWYATDNGDPTATGTAKRDRAHQFERFGHHVDQIRGWTNGKRYRASILRPDLYFVLDSNSELSSHHRATALNAVLSTGQWYGDFTCVWRGRMAVDPIYHNVCSSPIWDAGDPTTTGIHGGEL